MASISDTQRAQPPHTVAEKANSKGQRRRSESGDRKIAGVVGRTQSPPPTGNRSNSIGPSSPRQLPTGIVRLPSSDNLAKVAGVVERTQSPPPRLQRANSTGSSSPRQQPKGIVKVPSRERLTTSEQDGSLLHGLACSTYSARDADIEGLMANFRSAKLITEELVNLNLSLVFEACGILAEIMKDKDYEKCIGTIQEFLEKNFTYSYEIFMTFHKNGRDIHHSMLMLMLKTYKKFKRNEQAIALYLELSFPKEGYTSIHKFMFNLILDHKQDNWELMWKQFLLLYNDEEAKESRKEFLDIIMIKCLESHQKQAESVVKFCVDNNCSPELTYFDKLVRCDSYKRGVKRLDLFNYILEIFSPEDPRITPLYDHLQALAKADNEPMDFDLHARYKSQCGSSSTTLKSK